VQRPGLAGQLPRNAFPGDHEGGVAIGSSNAKDRPIRVTLRITPDTIVNRGDDDPSRLTRLRWLNSQLAADDEVVAPYTPLRLAGNTVSLLGRSFTFGADGKILSVTGMWG